MKFVAMNCIQIEILTQCDFVYATNKVRKIAKLFEKKKSIIDIIIISNDLILLCGINSNVNAMQFTCFPQWSNVVHKTTILNYSVPGLILRVPVIILSLIKHFHFFFTSFFLITHHFNK